MVEVFYFYKIYCNIIKNITLYNLKNYNTSLKGNQSKLVSRYLVRWLAGYLVKKIEQRSQKIR
ncbi:MAG TPA: hypothetical protein DCK79_05360 [Candidatus Atribacteria bacterium]|nr:hypothetical protein [Candidatus Atribacteria bacterium]